MKKPTFLNASLYAAALLSLSVLLAQCSNAAEEGRNDTAAATETAMAEAPVHKASDPLERGAELYLSYCKICHGAQGQAGPMADLLKIPPPDLTQIAARRDGNYPEELVFDIIKGNENLKGHGGLMPVWGETFRESENLETEEEVNAEVRKIVAYLKTLQEG